MWPECKKKMINKAFMLLYEKYSLFIFSSYFTLHHPFQWVKYSSNQKIFWSSAIRIKIHQKLCSFFTPQRSRRLCPNFWLLCAYVVYLLLLLHCGALVGCPDVSKTLNSGNTSVVFFSCFQKCLGDVSASVSLLEFVKLRSLLLKVFIISLDFDLAQHFSCFVKTVECGQIFLLAWQLRKKAQHNFIDQFKNLLNLPTHRTVTNKCAQCELRMRFLFWEVVELQFPNKKKPFVSSKTSTRRNNLTIYQLAQILQCVFSMVPITIAIYKSPCAVLFLLLHHAWGAVVDRKVNLDSEWYHKVLNLHLSIEFRCVAYIFETQKWKQTLKYLFTIERALTN